MEKEPKRLTLQEVANLQGCDTVGELLEQYATEACVPACCEDECEVEPDGECPHGHPSILLEAGLI